MKVVVRGNNLEQAMRVLKKRLQKDGRLRELKERQYYTKPSEEKRHKRNLAKLRNKYKNEKEQKNY